MKKRLTQIIVFLSFLLVLNFSAASHAFANFQDEEKTEENLLKAGTLTFSLSANDYFSLPLAPGVSATRSASIVSDGTLPFKYDIQTIKTGGDDNFCNALNLEAKLNGVVKYTGSLLNFILSPAVDFSSDDWEFIIKFDDNNSALQNKTCDFNFIFKAWQTDSDGNWGFKDEETLQNSVTSGIWVLAPASRVVINEVYYHGGSGIEWIEIYNAGTANADLNGWTVIDNNNTDTLAASSLILAPDSFSVVVGSNNSGQMIAIGAIRIVLSNTAIGNGLADAGDRLILKDNLGVVIDQMNYGSDTVVWDPARTGVATGHSLARSPKGFDADSPSDFVDLDAPNPGINPHPPVLVNTPASSLDFSLKSDKKAVSFTVTNISDFEKVTYEIVYDSNEGNKGIVGSADLPEEDIFSRSDLLLGTCSGAEGKVCVYDEGITKIHLKVTLDGSSKAVLEKEIFY